VAGAVLFTDWFASLLIELCPEKKPAEMHFEDVTEEELFDFDPIKESIINNKDHGLWAFHGLRKFRFYIENMDKHDLNEDCRDELQSLAVLAFNKKDNIKIPEIRMEHPIRTKKNHDNTEFFVYVDTNILGREFKDNTHRIQFFGSFEVTYSWETKPHYTEKYSFPVEMIMYNTNYYPDEQNSCIPLDLNPVSIDFGTSSTCVAVKNGMDIALLTLSSYKLELEDSSVNRFENPTTLMIYRWEKIYEQWKKENESLPLFLKGNRDDEKFKRKEVDFDYGYTVKEVLEDAQSGELNSVLTQLKLIPYHIEQGAQLDINPLIKEKTDVIKLVSSPEEEGKECFDPIAFYGYLLGRAINDPSNRKIYTKFDVTYPVKFNTKVREKLRASLAYGLKRSLPLPLREAKDKNGDRLLDVNMQYSEPVAYIGAICGRHLKLQNGKPELFAVYDFGGGTLDFSFGMFRLDEGDDAAIDIFGVDGNEKIGGENLISRISLWIYTDLANKAEMIKNNIPFEVPAGEKIPEGFPGKLLNKSGIAKANVHKINEIFSRKLFENRLKGDNETAEVALFTENNDTVNVHISVDYFPLGAKLAEIIEKTIQDFKASMISNFERHKQLFDNGSFDVKNVHIYKSGNASRNKIVGEKMSEHFPENDIQLIDEVAMGENKMYAITPKTAVAFGQLRLRRFKVIESEDTPFKWHVYNEKQADGSLETKISRNGSKAWVKYGKIRGNAIDVHYSATPVKEVKDKYYTSTIKTKETYKTSDFYIRIFDESSIEYCVCAEGVSPNDEAVANHDCIVVLKLR
jgi:hypothetical protein